MKLMLTTGGGGSTGGDLLIANRTFALRLVDTTEPIMLGAERTRLSSFGHALADWESHDLLNL